MQKTHEMKHHTTTGHWGIWTFETTEALATVKSKNWFWDANDKLRVGDEVHIRVKNPNEWAYIGFFILDIDKKNASIATKILWEHDLREADAPVWEAKEEASVI